jgi:ParB family chromosome partitioning protein
MTTTAQATPEQRDAVLKHHKNGRDPATIAAITRLAPTTIDDILATATGPATNRQAHGLEGLVELPMNQVHPSPNNPREHLTDIDGLAASIREAGLIQPIVVQPIDGGYQVVAGHRRLAALQLLGRLNVECIVRKPLRSDEELLTMLIENGQRAGLDPIEEARALNRLKVQHAITESEVARRVGRSITHVAGRIMLLSLPVDQQEQIRLGLTSMTEARATARVASGRIRYGAIGRPPPGHLSSGHPLAARAKAACLELRHSRGRGVGVGGIACGQCWEAVIRANEREKIHAASAVAGRCLICGTPHDPDRADS